MSEVLKVALRMQKDGKKIYVVPGGILFSQEDKELAARLQGVSEKKEEKKKEGEIMIARSTTKQITDDVIKMVWQKMGLQEVPRIAKGSYESEVRFFVPLAVAQEFASVTIGWIEVEWLPAAKPTSDKDNTGAASPGDM
jgi:hypothetical protein